MLILSCFRGVGPALEARLRDAPGARPATRGVPVRVSGASVRTSVPTRAWYVCFMTAQKPTYDPAELAKYDMTEEEAEAVREGLEELDRGESIPLARAFDELHAELEALLEVQQRRTG